MPLRLLAARQRSILFRQPQAPLLAGPAERREPNPITFLHSQPSDSISVKLLSLIALVMLRVVRLVSTMPRRVIMLRLAFVKPPTILPNPFLENSDGNA
jgi:hypothetical protein